MTSETIDHGTLAKLVEAGTVRAARVVGQDGGWGVIVKDRKTERPLAAHWVLWSWMVHPPNCRFWC